MYEIFFKPEAHRALLRMPKNQALLIRSKIEALKENPYTSNNNITKLQGIEGYRLRIGNWRVIYHLSDVKLEILVIKIASRGEIYQ